MKELAVTLNAASFSELMTAASKKLGKHECLILADISSDMPNLKDAFVTFGEDSHFVARPLIVAYARA